MRDRAPHPLPHLQEHVRARSPRGNDPHDAAVLRAEVTRVVHALRPYRILRHEALEREAGAQSWHQQGFERALRAAVAAGAIEKLPLGFYRLPSARDTPAGPGHDAA